MPPEVRLEQLDSIPLAVVRRRARPQDVSRVVLEAIGTVWTTIRARQISGAGRNVALYVGRHNDLISLEAGVEMDTPFTGHAEVVASSTPAGWVATATHVGPYGQLHQAHEAILSWCRSNGQKLAGPSWEIYGHWTEEMNRDPSRIRTEVFYLIER